MSNPLTVLKYGVLTFICAIVFGILEPVMLGFRTSGSSALMNETVTNIALYGWRALGLLAITLIIVGATGIIKSMNLFGSS